MEKRYDKQTSGFEDSGGGRNVEIRSSVLATGHSVDALSLALTLKDDTDERVEQAVEELLSEVWRKIDGRKI